MTRILILITSLMFLFIAPLYAGDTSTLRCEFDKFSNEKSSNQKEKLVINILFDFKNQKTYLLGNNGSSEVESVLNKIDKAITFIEITDFGNVMLTTVNQNDNKAVHSRHTIFNGKMLPSQYYGTCKKMD